MTTKRTKKAAPAKKRVLAQQELRPVGRPTLYREDYAEQAHKLCLLGATDKELADFFEVAESTVSLWKLEHQEFSEAVKSGKTQADAKVAESLFKRATGYVGQKTVTANVAGAITDVKVVDEYVGPDVAAGIFWLKNRQRDKWREKLDHELAGPNGGPIETKSTVTHTAEEAYLIALGGKRGR